jgi:type VII secretion-associated serine protease mycosin
MRKIAAVLGLAGVLGATPSPAADRHYWIDQLGLPRAWQLSRGDGVTVGVLDTGVDRGLPDLSGAVLPGRAFPDLGNGVNDAWGHGTTVAMLIAGRGAAGATTGVAPRATILPVTTAGTAETVDQGIRWLVDQHVKVINLSVVRPGTSGDQASTDFDAALRYAGEHDVVVVAAAGNSSEDAGVVSPANRPGVVAVSAVDRSGAFRPEISVEGPEVALSAPGADMVTAAEVRAGKPGGDGTSYSAALVTGVIALVRARFPALGAADVVRLVESTARDAGPAGRDPRYGYGVVDPVAALTATPPQPVQHRRRWLVPVVSGAVVVALAGAALVFRRRRSSL